jgi:hypothetical protein
MDASEMLSELASIVTFTMRSQTGVFFLSWEDVVEKLEREESWAYWHQRFKAPMNGIPTRAELVSFIEAHPGRMWVSLALVNALRSMGLSPVEFQIIRFYNKIPYESSFGKIETASIQSTMSRYIKTNDFNEKEAKALMNAAEVLRACRISAKP